MRIFRKITCIMLALILWYAFALPVQGASAFFAQVYNPVTGLSVPAAVITQPDDLNAMKLNPRPPGVAIIGVKQLYGELIGYGMNSGKIFGPLSDVTETLKGIVIPAFYIKNEETADALANFLIDNVLHDVNVISNVPELVYRVRRAAPMARGIIDFRTPENSHYNRYYYVKKTNASLARVALLDAETATPELIRYIRRLGVTVWVEENITENRLINLHIFLQKGMDGVVSGSNYQDLYYVFAAYTGHNGLIRHPFIIGHRGHPSMAPENTMASFRSAVKHGADKIEADLMVTADNRLVITNNINIFPLTSNFNPNRHTYGTMPVINVQQHSIFYLQRHRMTGSYLNARNIPEHIFSDSNERLPTVYDVLRFAVANDVVAVLEFKDFWPTSPRLLIDAIKTTGAFEHVIVAAHIPDGDSLLCEVFAELPGISLKGFTMGFNGYFIDRERPEESLLSVKNITQQGNRIMSINNHQPEHSPTLLDSRFMRAANNRGLPIVPWTFGSNAEIFANVYRSGVTGLITGSVHMLENAAIKLNSRHRGYVLQPGESVALNATINTRTQTGIPVIGEVVILSGEDKIITNGNRVFATFVSEESTAYVMLRFHVNAPMCSDTNVYWDYTIYSAPIRISINPGALPQTPPTF